MNATIWLALALVLVLEGLGPLLYPRAWRRMVATMSQLPDNLLRRFGGGLVVAGFVIYYMLTKSLARSKVVRLAECLQKCCNSEKRW